MKFRACELEPVGRREVGTDYDEELHEGCRLPDSDAALLASCCGAGPEPALGDDCYATPFRRVVDRIAAEETRAAEETTRVDALYDELMGIRSERREPAIHAGDRFVSYALAERLLDASREVRDEQPGSSLELARLALAIADRLDSRRCGAGLVGDLRARAWAYLGNLWAESSPAAAGEAFRLALGHLMHGSGDPHEEAEVLSLCVLATDDLESTLDRLDHAASIYRRTGDFRRLGDVLARKARVSGAAGEHLQAVGLLREALALSRSAAPSLSLADLSAELAHHLVATGRPEEAWDEVARARSLLSRSAPPDGDGPAEVLSGLRLRLCWIEGRIADALGLPEESRERLEEAREGFLASGRRREAVRAHLDLAALGSRIEGPGYDRAMERLADDTPRVLVGGELPRESATVLMLIEQAARRRALRPDLVTAVTDLLERVA